MVVSVFFSEVCNCRRDGTDSCFNTALFLAEDIILLPYDVVHVIQSKFFETFGGAFTKRGLLLKFLVLGGATTIGYLGSTSSGDFLPIKNGPKQDPVMGPRGRK